MAIKITTPTNGGDSINFGSGVTAIAAEVTGSEVSSGEGKLEFKTTTGGTSAAKMTIDGAGAVTLATPLPVASGGTGSATGGINLQTEVASTSGTSIDWTIPAGVKRISMHFDGVSTSGTSVMMVQIGPSGGVETSGYISTATMAGSNEDVLTIGFSLLFNNAATQLYEGRVTFELGFAASNTWTAVGMTRRLLSNEITTVVGSKPLAGELSIIRLTTEGGSDTFDLGEVNISWEF